MRRYHAAIWKAVNETLVSQGVDALKKTSLFASNDKVENEKQEKLAA